jgi:hypothetical protein
MLANGLRCDTRVAHATADRVLLDTELDKYFAETAAGNRIKVQQTSRSVAQVG